jgi:hypothetical protein
MLISYYPPYTYFCIDTPTLLAQYLVPPNIFLYTSMYMFPLFRVAMYGANLMFSVSPFCLQSPVY